MPSWWQGWSWPPWAATWAFSSIPLRAIERAYDGDRRREFDAHELLAFAVCFELPLIWFFLPPPEDRRFLRGVRQRVSDLYEILLGRGPPGAGL